MEQCPAEVLHQICTFLAAKDVASVRLTSKSLADVGAHHLVSRVRFHCSEESLKRFENISNHKIFSQTVKSVCYEGNMLLNVASRDTYVNHFSTGGHRHEMPQPPVDDSPRATRLYTRNFMKWRNDVHDRFEAYRKSYQIQQRGLPLERAILAQALHRLPRLSAIEFSNTGKCRHVLSERMLEDFGEGFFLGPLDVFSDCTLQQMDNLLSLNHYSYPALMSLKAEAITLHFFSNPSTEAAIMAVFAKLKKLKLVLRPDQDDLIESGELGTNPFSGLKQGCLKRALAQAASLESLSLGFECAPYHTGSADIHDIIGETAWPFLANVSFDLFVAKADPFISFLKAQPVLKYLSVCRGTLGEGSWDDLLDEMRDELNLKSAAFFGYIDNAIDMEFWCLDYLYTDAYLDGIQISLGDMIDCYLTEKDDCDIYCESLNPLHCMEDYASLEELQDHYGSGFGSDDDDSTGIHSCS